LASGVIITIFKLGSISPERFTAQSCLINAENSSSLSESNINKMILMLIIFPLPFFDHNHDYDYDKNLY
ncbi:hypothetical protein DERP_006229, partial [Dermatophagoides pteronyssinus]